MPEVKTLRRKLSQLAARKGSQALGQEIAQRRIREHGHVFGFLYVDGHVRAYHGKHTIPKAYITRARLAAPATTDYWVNDQRGDPLFVVTAEANAALTRMLPTVLGEVRKLLGPKRRATVVFDRGGWSPGVPLCRGLRVRSLRPRSSDWQPIFGEARDAQSSSVG